MTLDLLKESLRNAPVIPRGEYNYFIHPISDGIPLLTPDLLMECCLAFQQYLDLDADYILTIESMGIHIAAILSEVTGLPVNIVRKKQYWLDGEKILDQSTGYSKGKLYMNRVGEGDKVLIVDSVISTGGTLITVLKALEELDAQAVDVGCVIGRGDGKKLVKETMGVEVKTLVDIEVKDNVKIIESIDQQLLND